MALPALYEIAAEYRTAVELLADLDLPPEVVADTLESLAGDMETKSTNVAMFIDRVEGRDAALSRRVPSHDGLEGNGTGHHE